MDRVGATKLTSTGPDPAAGHLHAAGRDRLALGPDDDAPREARRVLHAQGDVHAARPAAGRRRHQRFPPTADADGAPEGRERHPQAACPACHAFINPFGFMQENFDAHRPLADDRTTGCPSTPSISVDFLDEGPLTASTPVDALQGLHRLAALQAVLRAPAVPVLHGPRRDARPTIPVLRQMFFEFANDDEQDDRAAAARARRRSTSFSQRSEAP